MVSLHNRKTPLRHMAIGQSELGSLSTETPSDDAKLCQAYSWSSLGHPGQFKQEESFWTRNILWCQGACISSAPLSVLTGSPVLPQISHSKRSLLSGDVRFWQCTLCQAMSNPIYFWAVSRCTTYKRWSQGPKEPQAVWIQFIWLWSPGRGCWGQGRSQYASSFLVDEIDFLPTNRVHWWPDGNSIAWLDSN